MVLDRFAFCEELGIKHSNGLEISSAIYLDTKKSNFLRVEIIHDPTRSSLPKDVPWFTQVLACQPTGAVMVSAPLSSGPCLTREEILCTYAARSISDVLDSPVL
jgi:hypothetical protein